MAGAAIARCLTKYHMEASQTYLSKRPRIRRGKGHDIRKPPGSNSEAIRSHGEVIREVIRGVIEVLAGTNNWEAIRGA